MIFLLRWSILACVYKPKKITGASLHMLIRKDLNSVELETVRISESPTTVVTANCEVQKKEEATLYVKGLNLFVKVKLLEDTPVLSLGKLCEDHGYSLRVDQ